MSSIRRAILLRLSLGAAALLLCGVVAFTLFARDLLTRQFDDALHAKVMMLATLVEQDGNRVEFDADEVWLPEFEPGEAPEYFQVWVGEQPLGRSPSLGAAELPRRHGPDGAPLSFDVTLPDGRRGRARGVRTRILDYERTLLANPGPLEVTLVVARRRAELDAALVSLLAGGAAGSLLLLLAVVWLVSRVTSTGLAPVGALVRHVERIDDPTDAPAYPLAATPLELRPIAAGVNRLVHRLAQELRRERRTAANIAHELRTPITELLTLCEVSLRCEDDPRQALEGLRQIRAVGYEMRRLIVTLLDLARLESGRAPLEPEPVELVPLIEACWEPLADHARARDLSFRLSGARPVVVADRGVLSLLCSNLLGNAVDHSPPHGRIECSLTDGPGAALDLANPADGLRAEDLDKLGEPFWRASAAREDRGHAGLGLALVRRLSHLLHAEVAFALEDGTFRARLTFAPLGEPAERGRDGLGA